MILISRGDKLCAKNEEIMASVDVRIRYSAQNVHLDKVADLTREGRLVYNDEGGDLKAHLKTAVKFTLLTASSPLIALARLVRSAAFVFTGDFNRAGREFAGALATPLLTASCLAGTLLSTLVTAISSGKNSFYVPMRRTYAFFEAWTNQIDLNSPRLGTYSSRVSSPTDPVGTTHNNRVWTTAPCMQPLLENGFSENGGLLDAARIQRMFPFVKVNGVRLEGSDLVIQSEYEDANEHFTACGGAYEHMRKTKTFCCCFRIEAVYDRFLCCQVAQGSCATMADHGSSCGFVSCGACGAGVCCCYTTEKNQYSSIQSGCIGPQGLSCLPSYTKRA